MEDPLRQQRPEADKRHKLSQYSAVLWNEKSLPRQFRVHFTEPFLSATNTHCLLLYIYHNHVHSIIVPVLDDPRCNVGTAKVCCVDINI